MMDLTNQDVERLQRITCGNAEALDWAARWLVFCHLIDDIVDGDVTCRQEILRSYIVAQEIYTHPFFLRHPEQLRGVARMVTNAYADSVDWEKSPDVWKAQAADVLRHAGLEMLCAVADICGGYQHMRGISQELRTVAALENPK